MPSAQTLQVAPGGHTSGRDVARAAGQQRRWLALHHLAPAHKASQAPACMLGVLGHTSGVYVNRSVVCGSCVHPSTQCFSRHKCCTSLAVYRHCGGYVGCSEESRY